jgi:NAD+ kinase
MISKCVDVKSRRPQLPVESRDVNPPPLRRLGVVVHPRRELQRALDALQAWAAGYGGEVVQIPVPGQEREVAPPGEAADCDVIVALGGDGTTLAALRAGAAVARPVLGVACGSIGALTATTADELDEALAALAAGDWRPRPLPGIAVSGDAGDEDVAINDLVVVRKGASQVAVSLYVDGELYVRYAGDGLVVATPLGSSAYTMAAGGPVLAPGAESLAVTPLAPHGGCCPPLVAGSASRVTAEIEPGHAGARIEIDGQIRPIEPRRLELSWRAAHATLVQFAGAEPLLAGLRRRRILIDSPRVTARDDRAAATTRR